MGSAASSSGSKKSKSAGSTPQSNRSETRVPPLLDTRVLERQLSAKKLGPRPPGDATNNNTNNNTSSSLNQVDKSTHVTFEMLGLKAADFASKAYGVDEKNYVHPYILINTLRQRPVPVESKEVQAHDPEPSLGAPRSTNASSPNLSKNGKENQNTEDANKTPADVLIITINDGLQLTESVVSVDANADDEVAATPLPEKVEGTAEAAPADTNTIIEDNKAPSTTEDEVDKSKAATEDATQKEAPEELSSMPSPAEGGKECISATISTPMKEVLSSAGSPNVAAEEEEETKVQVDVITALPSTDNKPTEKKEDKEKDTKKVEEPATAPIAEPPLQTQPQKIPEADTKKSSPLEEPKPQPPVDVVNKVDVSDWLEGGTATVPSPRKGNSLSIDTLTRDPPRPPLPNAKAADPPSTTPLEMSGAISSAHPSGRSLKEQVVRSGRRRNQPVEEPRASIHSLSSGNNLNSNKAACGGVQQPPPAPLPDVPFL